MEQMVKTHDVLWDSTTGFLHQARGFQPVDIRYQNARGVWTQTSARPAHGTNAPAPA